MFTRTALAIVLLTTPVAAHDIYNQLYSGGAPGVGQWCCNGDKENGDCEAVGSSYRVNPDGSVLVLTKRYGEREVLVARDKITWLPVPGGESSEAHWCGTPRAKMIGIGTQEISEEQIDPRMWTYCLFIVPGGV